MQEILLCFESWLVVLPVPHHPELLADLAAQYNPPVPHDHVLLLGGVGEVVRWLDEVCFDVVLQEVGVSLPAVAVLHLIVAVQVHQGLGCDVNATETWEVVLILRLYRYQYMHAHPGSPALSMMFASVTSLLQTSNCHFLRPSTPQWTLTLERTLGKSWPSNAQPCNISTNFATYDIEQRNRIQRQLKLSIYFIWNLKLDWHLQNIIPSIIQNRNFLNMMYSTQTLWKIKYKEKSSLFSCEVDSSSSSTIYLMMSSECIFCWLQDC